MKIGFALIKTISMCLLVLALTSCGTLLKKNEGVTGKQVKAEETAASRIGAVNDAIVLNDRQKLQTIGVFATGTEYALSKVEDPPKEVEVARELNARVMTLSETPALNQLKEVHSMVDNLISVLEEHKNKGLSDLADRDSRIYTIQLQKKALEQAKEREIKRYMDVAQVAASRADQFEATLGEMDSWWGLGAIFYGVKKLITRAFIFISILTFVYLALRVASTMHPAAAAAFQIFDLIASVFINIIKGLAPGAAKIAKLVPEATSTLYKQTLGHVVDNIELLKLEDKKAVSSGQPLKKYTLNDILSMFGESMDQANKDVIDEVKAEVNWK